jgi:hypothetical protein
MHTSLDTEVFNFARSFTFSNLYLVTERIPPELYFTGSGGVFLLGKYAEPE